MSDFEAIVKRYLEIFPKEETSLQGLGDFLSIEPSDELRVSRKNYRGHMTASCLFVDAPRRRVLLLFHPSYQLILQPGGHFAASEESPLEAATRKLFEETIYSKEQSRYLAFDYNTLVPLDIDTHHIPRNEARGERSHVHHDFRYVFLCTVEDALNSEVRSRPSRPTAHDYSYFWYEISELRRFSTFARIYPKLEEFLGRDSARRRFYIRLVNDFGPVHRVNTIVVTHLLPDSFDFIDALARSTNLVGVIPKPKSIHPPTKKRLAECGIPILEISRSEVVEKVKSLLNNSTERAVLLDIGGWFSPLIGSLPTEVAERILGIVEDTRNGQNKYEAIAKATPFPYPVVSVAESALKENEDFLVGQSIVFSADVILREYGLILEYLECGIIGYGKIGRSIAHHLQQRGLKPYVVERAPLRRLKAYRELCGIRGRDWVSRNVDLVFCATGSRATDIIDFRDLRPGAFVFSVTSSDDEFDLDLLASEYQRTDLSEHLSRYDGNQNHFFLVNQGNAVNFLHHAVLWEFIQLVKGGIFVALRNLVENRPMDRASGSGFADLGSTNLLSLSEEDQSAIAAIWMETVLLGVSLEV